MSSLLITGASGFIGSFVASDLVKRGIPVTCAGRSNPNILGARYHMVPNIDGNTDWADVFKGIRCIIHAAGRAHVLHETTTNPYTEFRAINFEGTIRLAQQAAIQGVKTFVFVSSIGVNGSTSTRPFTEKDIPAPKGPYAEIKLEAEYGLRKIAETTGLNVVIVRPPLVYGPGCPGNFLRLMRLAYSGLPLPLDGINNRRNLIGIWNLSDFLIRCATDDRAHNKTFVVADRELISTSDLVRAIASYMNRPKRMFAIPKGAISVAAKLPKLERIIEGLWGNLEVNSAYARSELTWTPPVPLLEGLRRTSAWYCLNRGAV